MRLRWYELDTGNLGHMRPRDAKPANLLGCQFVQTDWISNTEAGWRLDTSRISI